MMILETNFFVTCKVDEDEKQSVCSFWTPELMARAKPEDMYVEISSVDLSMQDANPSYDADLSEAPFCCGGTIFYVKNGMPYKASAQFVGGNKIVMTAAHCVQSDSGEWAANMVFCQAYKNGSYKQLVPVMSMSVRKEWQQKNRFPYDYALMVTEKESSDMYLDYEILLQTQTATAMGYPGNIKEGKIMQKVTGDLANTDHEGIVAMIGVPFKQGASGGAWIKDCGHANLVVGLNSFITVGNENVMFGPLLDEKFDALFQYVQQL